MHRWLFLAFLCSLCTLQASGHTPATGGSATAPLRVNVAIVGGGLGGLSTAYHLRLASISDLHIFEARKRLGGRVWTVDNPDGSRVEMGGEVIEPDETTILALLEKLRMPTTKVQRRRNIVLRTRSTPTSPATLMNPDEVADMILGSDIEGVLAASGTERSLAEAVATLPQPLQTIADLYCRDNEGLPVTLMTASSKKDVLPMIQAIGEFLHITRGMSDRDVLALSQTEELYAFRIKGGNSTLVHRLAKTSRASTHFSHHLKAIRKESDGRFKLLFQATTGMQTVYANAVVLALPLTCLRHVTIDPSVVEVTPSMRTVIKHAKYATNSKVLLPLTPKSEDAKPPVYLVDGETGVAGWPNQEHVPGAQPWMSLIASQESQPLVALNRPGYPDTATLKMVDALMPLMPEFNVRTDVPIRAHNWAMDPFAQGCWFVANAVYTDAKMIAQMNTRASSILGYHPYAQPVSGAKLVLAGEHVVFNNGTMDAAVRSGILAATHLLPTFYGIDLSSPSASSVKPATVEPRAD